MYILNPSNKWNSSRHWFESPWTSDNLAFDCPSKCQKEKKTVKFENFCRVVLIPKRDEYTKAGIKLWWSQNEYSTFKKERMAEMDFSHDQQPHSENRLKITTVSCYDISIRVLVITNAKASKTNILGGLSRFLWSEENENRFSTNIVVNFVTFNKVESILIEDPCYYNVVVIDSPPSNSFQMFQQFRVASAVSVIVCIAASRDFLQVEDGASEVFADLVLARPELPSCAQWADLMALLAERLESDDFLPSPLIQQYMSTL